MSKRNVSLYLDDELISLAKIKNINISEQLNSYLKVVVGCDLVLPENQNDLWKLKKEKEEQFVKVKSELDKVKKQLDDIKKEENINGKVS